MLSADALDFVISLEGMPKCPQMLAPGRRRRCEWLIRPERHTPFAAVVALLPVDEEGLLGLSGRWQDQRRAGSLENAFARCMNEAVSKAPAPIRKCRRSNMVALLQCARASERKDLLLPARATSSFTTVAGQGWLAGPKPALDALIYVVAAGSIIKAGVSQCPIGIVRRLSGCYTPIKQTLTIKVKAPDPTLL